MTGQVTLREPKSIEATAIPLLDKPASRKKISLKSWKKGIPFILLHFAGLVLPFLYPPTTTLVILAITSFYIRMFSITGGYHRYFSHRTFKTSRWFQFILAFIGTASTQKGPIWWAANHRHHHANSDGPNDIHSPVQDGFLYSHMGWILADSSDPIRWNLIKDFAKYPELKFLDKHYWLPPVVFALGMFLIAGLPGLIWGYFLPTVILWHATYTINSLCHVFGSRRYETKDDSRNNLWLALLTMGEGWHNNHHYYCNTVNQGWFWYEVDFTYYILLGLKRLGVVWDFKYAPNRIKFAHKVTPKSS